MQLLTDLNGTEVSTMPETSKKLITYILSLSIIISSALTEAETLFAAKKPVLSKKKLTLTVGKSKKLKVNHVRGKIQYKWKSKNKKIAKVSKKGTVTAKRAGKTTITCKFRYKGKKYTKKCSVTVKKKSTTSTKKTTQPTKAPETSADPKPPAGLPVTPTEVPGTPIPDGEGAKVLALDFEDGTNPYVTGRQGKEEFTVVPGGYGDKHCLKVSNRTENWAGPQINLTHKISDYTSYTIEAYVKQTTGNDKTINCMWDSVNLSNERKYTTIKTLTVPSGIWRKIEATVVSPGDIKEISLYFEMPNYTNDFYIDNIAITEKHLNLEKVLAVDSLKEVYSGRFPVGCAIYSYHLKNPEIAAFISHHYNTVTFENELKPESLLDEEKTKAAADGMPVIHKDVIDKCLGSARENNLKVRVHTLVWHLQTPDWYFCEGYEPVYDGSGTAKSNITNLVDEATMLKRMESYITQIVTYIETNYPGTAYTYDVVNEVINESTVLRTGSESLYAAIFGEENTTYITEAFHYAKAAITATSSQAKLFYNDYNVYSPEQRAAIIQYLADAKKSGYIDGIGMQSHQSNLRVTDGDNIKNSISYFKENGYEVNITELDYANKDNSASGNATLATAYTKFMTNIFEEMDTDKVSITNVTFWGLTDASTWLNAQDNNGPYYPLLFDENYMPKAAFTALIDLAKSTPSSLRGE